MAAKFDLIIFDCDGVLIDSEVISTHTLLDTLGVHGLEVDIGYVRRTYLGRTISVVKSDYLRLMGRDLAETFEADFLGRLAESYRRDLVAMAGVRELLSELTLPYCMATSSSVDRAMLSLEVTGLLPFFEGRIFCGSMVKWGKPAPDLFLHAANTLGAEPKNCLVIEDSEAGLLAGENAGMTVWRFVGGSHFRDAGDAVVSNTFNGPAFDSMDAMAAALRNS
jgi:HAD superfamily hydrolase (TIGR01509 family)